MEEYLEGLADKYKARALIEKLLMINFLIMLTMAVWIYSIDSEQQRRSDAIQKVRKEMIN